MSVFSINLPASLLFAVVNGAALSLPRIIGFLLASSVLGFLIGSMFALMSLSVIRSSQASGEFPVKKAMVIGGTLGAVIASASLLILMF